MNAKHVGLALGGIGVAAALAFAPSSDHVSRRDAEQLCAEAAREGEKFAAQHGEKANTEGFDDACVEAVSGDWQPIEDSTPVP